MRAHFAIEILVGFANVNVFVYIGQFTGSESLFSGLAQIILAELLSGLADGIEYLPIDGIYLATTVIIKEHKSDMVRLEYNVSAYLLDRDNTRTKDYH